MESNNSKVRKNIKKNVAYNISDKIINFFENFFESSYCTKSNRSYTSFCSIFLNHRHLKDETDFSDDTFYYDFQMADDDYITSYNRPMWTHEKALLKNLYSYALYRYPDNFVILNNKIINHNNIFSLITNNYKMIKRNIFSEVPQSTDKWIFIDDKQVFSIDFSLIKNKKYKLACQKFFWEDTSSKTETKYKCYHALVKVSNLLPTETSYITYKMLSNIKKEIVSEKKSQTGFIYLSNVKSMLAFFEDIGIIKINKTAIDALKMNNVRSNPITDYYSQTDIETILKNLTNSYARESNRDIKTKLQLQIIAILYALNTPMRLETILSLKLNDLKQIDNNYYYLTDSKTKSEIKYNITHNIKKLHDEIIRITNDYRTGNSPVEKYLFIYRRTRGNIVSLLNKLDLNRTLNKAAVQSDINPLGITGIRNRFMNNIINKTERGIEKATLQALSKHSLNVHYNYYYKNNIQQLAAQLFGVTIGDIDLKGVVLPKEDINVQKMDIVMNGRGYCSSEKCKENNILDCLMCRWFRCTPINIPYFKIEIDNLNKKIEQQGIQHEKEFLIAKKKLNVAYLFKCLELTEKEENKDE